MKLVIVTNNYPPVLDGVGDHSFFLSEELKRQGHTVYIICSKKKEIINRGYNNVFSIVEKWNGTGFKIAIKRIKLLQPDFVLLQYVPYGFQRIGLPLRIPLFVRTLSKNGLAVIIHFHEMFVRLNWRLRKIFPVGIIQRFLAFMLCRYATRIITSTSFYKDSLSNFTQKPIEIISIPPNFDTEMTYSTRKLAELSNTITPDKNPVVATFGVRDSSYIVEVFEMLLKQNKQIRFLICGQSDTDQFKAINEFVYFTGYIAAAEVPYFLKTASIFFLPDFADKKNRGGTSRKSGSLAAALFAGIPVVGIKGDNNGKEVQLNPTIFLENYYDKNGIVNRILSILKTPSNERTPYDSTLYWKYISTLYFPGPGK